MRYSTPTVLCQFLQLTEEEIAILPPGDWERVIELRNQNTPGPSAQPPSTMINHPVFITCHRRNSLHPGLGILVLPQLPAQQQRQMADEDSQQAALLVQVLQMTEEEIAILPPGDRERVIELPIKSTTIKG
ncbi:unnamed protein product, partial [Mesorhabditis belari]|uniref:Transcription termination and cleavage factor C-terminal domain-containing protein n=1 Tax=Mesorhabditis belari TaxID=2138241 RepID=A0AAF3JB05_9BILA